MTKCVSVVRLAIEDLSAGFSVRPILTNLDLSAAAGQVIGIYGRNGSGKTTLARVMAGLHRARTGRIWLDGQEITHLRPWQRVGLGLRLVPQSGRVFRELTVEENFRLLGGQSSSGTAKTLMPASVTGTMWLEDAWRWPAGNLSGGRQTLLALGAAMSSTTKLLIFDEPAAGLDDEMVEIAANLVQNARAHGTTIVFFEHRRVFSRLLADKELVLEDGYLQ